MLVTEKGQVTIPKPLRDELGITPGTHVDFAAVDGHLEVRIVQAPTRGRQVVKRLHGAAGPGMSTDELMALTRADD